MFRRWSVSSSFCCRCLPSSVTKVSPAFLDLARHGQAVCLFSTSPVCHYGPLSRRRKFRNQQLELLESEAETAEGASSPSGPPAAQQPSADEWPSSRAEDDGSAGKDDLEQADPMRDDVMGEVTVCTPTDATAAPSTSAPEREEEEPLLMTVPTRPRRTDMPRHLCNRWFLPGFGDLTANDTVPDSKKDTAAKSSGDTAAAATAPTSGGGDRSVEERAGQKEEKGHEASTALSAAVAERAPADADAEDAGDGSQRNEDYANDEDEGADGGEPIEDDAQPSANAFKMYQMEKNKDTKRLLMVGLGNEFARAGIHTDGVRTNFSVMSYQVVKQVTGLARIPNKLLLSCLVSPDRSIEWIDISAHPTATLTEYKEAVQEVLAGLGMHQTMIEDSAQPMLLPQVTVTKDVYAFVMRYAIRPPTNKQQDSLQDLTNRFTVFLGTNRIVTVHRTQCNFVEELKQDWQQIFQEEKRSQRYLLYYFVKEIAHTFSSAISSCIVEFDAYEAGLFSSSRNRSNLAREIYHIKRRASAYGRTLTLTQDAYSHVASSLKIYTSDVFYQEIQHDLAHVQSLADELNANADSVLQLLFQLSSYQVNELMRVLTLFSAFFIPLSFIASAYGMNFDGLPFLHSPNGELYCAFIMLSVAAVIFVWFKKKNFM